MFDVQLAMRKTIKFINSTMLESKKRSDASFH